MVPAIRSVASVPAGVAKMPVGQVQALSALGTAIWTSLLMTADYKLGSDHEHVTVWADPFSNLVIASLIGIHVVCLINFRT